MVSNQKDTKDIIALCVDELIIISLSDNSGLFYLCQYMNICSCLISVSLWQTKKLLVEHIKSLWIV